MQVESADRSAGKRSQGKKIVKIAGFGMIIAIVFLTGIGVGSGSIVFSSSNDANKQAPENLDYSSVEQLYDMLRASYDGKLDKSALLDGMKAGMASAAGDPYTQYFNPKDAKAFNQQLNGSFTGIGAELGQDTDKNLVVISPIDGFPAQKAGLRSQDIIVSIDGKTTSDMTVNEAVTHIRGEQGTEVTLRVLRNKKEDLSFKITREEIKIPSVKWNINDDNVGYLQISQFSEDTSGLTAKAAKEFADKHVKGVVLDLRDDPGGLLSAAVDVSSLWLPAGKTILQQKQGGVTVQTYTSTATGKAVLQGIPTAVLINSGSASASEIVAGALRDNRAATMFGEKSYGKGSVQEIHNLPNGGEVKITIARWYRPNGQNIDKKGIKPDTEVTMTDDDYKQDRDPQKAAALNFVITQ